MKRLLALLICLLLLGSHVQAGGGKTFRRKTTPRPQRPNPTSASSRSRLLDEVERRVSKYHPTLGRGTSPRRSTPFLRTLRYYTEQKIRNTVYKTSYSVSSIISTDECLAAVEKSLENPRTVSPTLISRLNMSATADVKSPDLTIIEFWDLAIANITQFTHYEFFKRIFSRSNKEKDRPEFVVLRDINIMGGSADRPTHILIPKGTHLKLLEPFKGEGRIVVGSKNWNVFVQRRLEKIRKDPQRIETLRQRALRLPLQKDVYVTKRELSDLLFSKKADKFFGPSLLLFGHEDNTMLAVPMKQAINVVMPSVAGVFQKYDEFSYAVPEIEAFHVQEGKGNPISVSFDVEKHIISPNNTWTPERVYQLLYGERRLSQTLFTAKTDQYGKTLFVPKQRMLYTNGGNSPLYVLSQNDVLRVRYSPAKGNSMQLLTEPMTYEQFKRAVLTGTFEAPKVVRDGQEMLDPNAEMKPAPKKRREKSAPLPQINWRKLLEEQQIAKEFVGKKVEKFTFRYADKDKKDVIFRMIPVKTFFVLPNGERVSPGDYLDFTSGELVVRSEWIVQNLFIKIKK